MKYITVTKLDETTTGSQCYVSWHPELPGIIGQGNSPDDAENSLMDATQMALEHFRKNGLLTPQPMTFQNAVFISLDYNIPV